MLVALDGTQVGHFLDLVLDPVGPSSPGCKEDNNVPDHTFSVEGSLELLNWDTVSNFQSSLFGGGMRDETESGVLHIVNRVVTSQEVVTSEPEVIPGRNDVKVANVVFIRSLRALNNVVFRQNGDPVVVSGEEEDLRPHSGITSGNDDAIPDLGDVFLALGEVGEETIGLVGTNQDDGRTSVINDRLGIEGVSVGVLGAKADTLPLTEPEEVFIQAQVDKIILVRHTSGSGRSKVDIRVLALVGQVERESFLCDLVTIAESINEKRSILKVFNKLFGFIVASTEVGEVEGTTHGETKDTINIRRNTHLPVNKEHFLLVDTVDLLGVKANIVGTGNTLNVGGTVHKFGFSRILMGFP